MSQVRRYQDAHYGCCDSALRRSVSDKKPIFEIPTIREYFLDLEYILGVISDGPAKSFAFRRLKYLGSKFTLYSLLNEYQEMADMKVSSASQLIRLSLAETTPFSITEGASQVRLHCSKPCAKSLSIRFDRAETSTTLGRSTRMSITQAA